MPGDGDDSRVNPGRPTPDERFCVRVRCLRVGAGVVGPWSSRRAPSDPIDDAGVAGGRGGRGGVKPSTLSSESSSATVAGRARSP